MSVDHWSISECETNDPSHPFPPVSCGLPCSWVYLKYYLISECIQVCSKLWPECSGTMVMFCRLFFNLAYKFIFHLKHPFNYMARCIDKLSSCVLFFFFLPFFPPFELYVSVRWFNVFNIVTFQCLSPVCPYLCTEHYE